MKLKDDDLIDLTKLYNDGTYCQCGEGLYFVYNDDKFIAYCDCGLEYRATIENVRITIIPAEGKSDEQLFNTVIQKSKHKRKKIFAKLHGVSVDD